ncbi:Ectoine hydroxylase-related dioxygenase, phytanoyl-CoA dioxygenase (PhyH) family [Cribrihabitans marinus]|uniref:Ectoine hydroxylase-related dioxygenase, phytanoyl-CoA dioxygenase (PhyH) family n=1 Tax=Cribrihabitans marinus TaxID=1227549 RepID=A0A1H6ZBB0_9RHOB|nr:phytanoyl-CoA dioxygenase family protein [Cribrihabitans marinus]GGH31196.1 phytanoyl-CoA dioxygenase [Cribrihabitans marinus]SEJ49344.1 Ectoine hydroxylase-related dioxygenase, phytanoyl-CoA dioxygenase (PhyH) family [Cribrihabitans marinus]
MTRRPAYYSQADCDPLKFADLVQRSLSREDAPNASALRANIPVYDMTGLRDVLDVPARRRDLMAEWARVLKDGPGVLVLAAAYADTAALDAATEVYDRLIDEARRSDAPGADHFAAAGSNDRIWNSLQKLCLAAPEVFLGYFANPAIDAVCEAWLGPNYQMTAQINLVHPGGQAQQAHRDYHLGFQTAEVSATYPAHVHDLSPLMTLQGGIAHCNMPVKSGPTKLLPFSQLYRPGYAAWRREDFRDLFERHHVQLPLDKGDALFFNPALFHAAGANSSADIHRMVNLLQVSSAFGRAMEAVDRTAMCAAVFAPLQRAWDRGELSEPELDAAIAATAEGYSFPTNLDTDPPTDGLAPQTQQALLKAAVTEGWGSDRFRAALTTQDARRRA